MTYWVALGLPGAGTCKGMGRERYVVTRPKPSCPAATVSADPTPRKRAGPACGHRTSLLMQVLFGPEQSVAPAVEALATQGRLQRKARAALRARIGAGPYTNVRTG